MVTLECGPIAGFIRVYDMAEAVRDDLARLAEGDAAELASVFEELRPRLERLVEFRLHPGLRGRVDTADVLQEAFLTISARLPSFLDSPDVSPFVWMRRLTLQCVVDTHRHHFRQKRNVGKEVKLSAPSSSEQTSLSIAQALFDPRMSPSQAAVQAEELEHMRQALEGMDEIDREVLALRHFERLSNNETAEELGLSATAASNRYIRAMARLADLMKLKP